MIIGLMFIGAVILIGIFVLVFVIGGYNALVTLRNRYKNAYSQIDVQLKRRYDLIPNLVETAKGYLQYERGTLEAVITARNAAATANARAAQNPGDAAAMKEISSAEKRVVWRHEPPVCIGRSIPQSQGEHDNDEFNGRGDLN